MSLRIPRGFARRHPAYQEIMEGVRPTLKWLKPADFLPIASVEARQEDPIVIPAGTFVGIVQRTGDAIASGTYALTGYNPGYATYKMVPAASQAYKLEYTTRDTDTTFYTPGVINIDGGAVVAAAGTSVSYVGSIATGGGVKPMGIVYNDIYASWLGAGYTNYDRQPNIGLLMRDQIIQVPCLNTNEWDIQPGDLVMVDGWDAATLKWDPGATPSTVNAVGRLRKWTAGTVSTNTTEAFVQLRRFQEHIVGRCIRKVLVASYSSASANASLASTVGSINSSHVNFEFRPGGRVQTVPGLGLQGSGTQGIPGHLLAARNDGNGKFWALEIAVSTY